MTGELVPTGETVIRAMRPDDAPEVFDVTMRAFDADLPTDTAELAELRNRWTGRAQHLARTDAHGAHVAEHGGAIVGAAQALVRDRVWALSLLVVAAEHRGTGLGRRLLKLALDYGREVPAGLIASSRDPAAIRSYVAAGFVLHPTVSARGPVRRSRLPALGSAVRAGDAADLPLTGDVSRRVRGGTHEPDLAEALRTGARLLLCGTRGFALHDRGEVRLLAATDEEAARTLLWRALAESTEQTVEFGWITAGQRWAVDIAVRAGLDLEPRGPLFVRGQPGPLVPYLPNGGYL